MTAIASIVVALIVAALLIANVMATRLAIRSELHEPRQKLFQCLLVWLLPFVGAALVLLVARDPHRKINRVYRSGLSANGDGSIGGGMMDGAHHGGGDY